jgi:OOP family OmpA-OmpF porin
MRRCTATIGALLLLLACPRVAAERAPDPPTPEPVALAPTATATPDPTQATDDRCPSEPECENGVEDGDGCPERVPDQLMAIVGVVAGLSFANTHSGTIDPSSFAQLESIAEILIVHPELHLEIRAHHDTRTADKYRDMGMKPTDREAKAVRDFLISRGVDSDRLTAQGYGESMPLAPNDTAEGRALNRRVELVPQHPAWANDPHCGQ